MRKFRNISKQDRWVGDEIVPANHQVEVDDDTARGFRAQPDVWEAVKPPAQKAAKQDEPDPEPDTDEETQP